MSATTICSVSTKYETFGIFSPVLCAMPGHIYELIHITKNYHDCDFEALSGIALDFSWIHNVGSFYGNTKSNKSCFLFIYNVFTKSTGIIHCRYEAPREEPREAHGYLALSYDGYMVALSVNVTL